VGGRLARVALAGVTTLSLTACYATNSYTLKLDAQQQSKSQLCQRSSASDQETCAPLASQTLEAPGVLAVEVVNTASDKNYTLRLAETVRGAASGPTPDDVVQEVSKRLTGLSSDFFQKLDPQPGVSTEAAQSLLVQVSTTLKGKKPAASAVLAGIAQGLQAQQVDVKPRVTAAAAVFDPWIDDTKPAWKTTAAVGAAGPLNEPSGKGRPPPRTLVYVPADLTYLDSKIKPASPAVELGGDSLADFTIAWCAPDSFGKYPFDNQLWVNEPAPWVDEQDLLQKLALDQAAIAKIVSGGGSDLANQIGKLLIEANTAVASGKQPSEPAKVIHYLVFASRIAHDLDHCERNLGSIARLPTLTAAGAKKVSATLLAVQAAHQRLSSTATALHVFETLIAPLATRAAVDELTKAGNGAAVAFGTYTLQPGHLSLGASARALDAGPEAQADPVAQLEFKVQDTGPVSVSVGPVVSVCSKCIHSVQESFSVVDDAGVPTVHRLLSDNTSSMSIGYAAMLHYSLWGGTRNQIGAAIGYPIRDQTGTALGVLAGVSYRNTVGLQISTGVHVFETQKPKNALPLDVSSGSAAALTPSDVTQSSVSAAWFMFIGATSDLLVK